MSRPGVSAAARRPPRPRAHRRRAGAVRITGHGALVTTYLVTSPTKFSSGPRGRRAARRRGSREGSSAASTIASTPRRRASSTIAWPARRARTVAVATCDALVLLAHRLGARAARRAPARAARRAAARRSAAPSGPRRPTAPRSSRPPSAGLVGVLRRRPGARRSARCRRRAACPMIGTRIEPYSGARRSRRAAPLRDDDAAQQRLARRCAGRRRRARARRPSSARPT